MSSWRLRNPEDHKAGSEMKDRDVFHYDLYLSVKCRSNEESLGDFHRYCEWNSSHSSLTKEPRRYNFRCECSQFAGDKENIICRLIKKKTSEILSRASSTYDPILEIILTSLFTICFHKKNNQGIIPLIMTIVNIFSILKCNIKSSFRFQQTQ